MQTLESKDAAVKIQGPFFDTMYLTVSGWFLVGSMVDAWAHDNVPQLETFWTPWHAVLYAGVFATGGFLLTVALINRKRGAIWSNALPQGYYVAGWGSIFFPFVGAGDAIWHTLFGIERASVDAMLSPTHLAGMICGWLLCIAPYTATRHRPPSSPGEYFRFCAAFSFPLIYLINLTQLINYAFYQFPVTTSTVQKQTQLFAFTLFLVQAFVLVGWTLYVLRTHRGKLPPGIYTVALTLCGIELAIMDRYYFTNILTGVVSGVAIDVAAFFLRPGRGQERVFETRVFAMLVGAAPVAAFLLVLEIFGGIIWTIHLSVGSVVVAGFVGLLLSLLIESENAEQLPLPAD